MYIRINERLIKTKSTYAVILLLYTLLMSVLMWNFAVLIFGILFSFILLKMVDFLLSENKESMYKLVACSWMIGMTSCLIIYYCYLIINGKPYIMSDDLLFDEYWSNLCIDNNYYAVSHMIENREFANHNSIGYVLLITYLKRLSNLVGGYHTLIPRILNITLLNISALISVCIAKKCWEITFNEEKKIFQWISLFPNCIYLCSHVYRDMLVTFLVVLVFYLWLGFRKRHILQKGIIIFITLLILNIIYYIREFMVLIILSIIFLNYLDFNSKRHSKNHTSKELIKYIGCMVLFIGICIVFNNEFRYVLHEMYGYSVRWSTIYSQGSRFYKVLAGFGDSLIITTLLKCAYYILTPMNGQLFNPFLWTSFLDIILSIITVGTFATFYLLPYVVKRLFRLDNVAITFLIIYVTTAATTTGFRHILLCYPFFFMLGVVGKFDVAEVVQNENRIAVSWMICAFIFIYYTVRIFSLLI